MMLWILFSVLAIGAQEPKPLTLDNVQIESFDSNGMSIASSIVRFGVQTKIPLGIVISDDGACKTPLKFQAEHESAKDVLDHLAKAIGYAWTFQNGVVVIHPREMSLEASQLLNTVIPRYAAPEAKLDAQRRFLWMDVRAVLRPGEGTIVNYATTSTDELLPAVDLHNIRLLDALNRTVSVKSGGEWILLPLPKDMREAADHSYIQMISYSNGDHPSFSCVPQ